MGKTHEVFLVPQSGASNSKGARVSTSASQQRCVWKPLQQSQVLNFHIVLGTTKADLSNGFKGFNICDSPFLDAFILFLTDLLLF